MPPQIKIKRIYDPVENTDGYRILVDRLWPRGVKKENAHLDEWAKDLTPSTAIRIAYKHVPDLWLEFKNRYLKELQNNDFVHVYLEKWEELPVITLLYAAKDTEHTHALVLQTYLTEQYKL